jgi:uncharacterized membrane protein HdeD (DUF308 family)
MLTPEKPILFFKKMLSMMLLILGILLAATGAYSGSTALLTLGVMLLAAGMIMLVMKIVRRNEGAHP